MGQILNLYGKILKCSYTLYMNEWKITHGSEAGLQEHCWWDWSDRTERKCDGEKVKRCDWDWEAWVNGCEECVWDLEA